jgi:exodeoxyribonuclease-3
VIVSTINVNGIRAAVKQRSTENLGLLAWLKETTAEVVCLQETRADDEQLADALAPALADGWHLASASPHLKGRNGVAVLSRHPVHEHRRMESEEFGDHGRYLEVDTGGLTVASVYVQTGEAETDRQLEKERFMAALAARMAEIHIKNWKGNLKKSGFLPGERQWVADLLATGWVDVVRALHPGVAGPYSWWSWRGRAFDNDAGWRIDYQLASPSLAPRALVARVERADAYALRWSDHAPVTVEYS